MKNYYTKLFVLVLTFLSKNCLYPQDIKFNSSDVQLNEYLKAFFQVKKLVETNGDFATAVFLVEKLYQKSEMTNNDFEQKINALAVFVTEGFTQRRLKKYNQPDSLNYLKNHSIFSSLFDSLNLYFEDLNHVAKIVPYSFRHEDPLGTKDWTNMFVTKLLLTGKGNCHSLSYLYKIVADKIGAKCWLSLAPNHIFIKNFSQYFGWYNTELTSRSFPTDAWVMTTSYIHPDAVRSGLYMDTLSNQQTLALCIHDLAKQYEYQTHNYYDGFILQCCDLVLQYHPVNPMTLLLKAETLRKVYDQQLKEKNRNIAETYKKMEAAYARLANLYYREMPEKMYLKWLENARNYDNKKIE